MYGHKEDDETRSTRNTWRPTTLLSADHTYLYIPTPKFLNGCRHGWCHVIACVSGRLSLTDWGWNGRAGAGRRVWGRHVGYVWEPSYIVAFLFFLAPHDGGGEVKRKYVMYVCRVSASEERGVTVSGLSIRCASQYSGLHTGREATRKNSLAGKLEADWTGLDWIGLQPLTIEPLMDLAGSNRVTWIEILDLGKPDSAQWHGLGFRVVRIRKIR
ncbi:hypothetical protein B0H65DRAFT_168895 [Neurospora tetraspora]|uniref:Uncharacterized protein n=1 Tax=Neurospora tetraspora TaxID=94610 RepID=A0AAE0JIQ7_9PEZI|nr:hypothetical protein B0H65DRAFT_168895 [Neurospora tetraspora]